VTETAGTILRRKTGAGRAAPEAAAMTPEKAMRLAFGRAGRAVTGLGLRLTGFAMERIGLAGLIAAADPTALVVTLTRADGSLGALVIDAGMRSALLEAQTMGRVARAAPPERPATRIDALIAGGFTDTALAVFDEVAAELAIAPRITGFRTAERVATPPLLALLLDDRPLRLLRLGFDFAEGARTGTALIALPLDPAPAAGTTPGGGFAQDLAAMVMAAPAEVRAVLTRLHLPLDELEAWAPGHLIALPRAVLDQVRLTDITGEVLAGGRLGQIGGQRAVRLRLPAA
jgi:flagellar motor switch protein FliM